MENQTFLEILASDSPAPGGGAGSALAGATGVALTEMALSISNKSYSDQKKNGVLSILSQLSQLREQLYNMIQEDEYAFRSLTNAYQLSKDNPQRTLKIQEGLITAASAPLKIMRLNVESITLQEQAKLLSKRMLLSDIATGTVLSRASLKGAYINVLVNTELIKDAATKSALNDEAESLLDIGTRLSDKIYDSITKDIKGG